MRKQLLLVLLALPLLIFGQQKANYDLAARFSPKKLDKMIFSLSVDPHWLKQSNKFWYTYETSEGKQWMIVDPVKNEKKSMFDKDQLAASLTRIIKDPFDAQHLPIDSLKFISAAETKFSKIKADVNNPEVVLFDEDANISLMKDGAYVQAWLWVDNSDIKVKKTSRRKSTAV